MKATQSNFLTLAQKAHGEIAIWFFCGPDEGGAQLAASRALAMLLEAGERVELTGGELKADPVRLVDEARSTSLFGGARHIWARVAGDEALKAVETFLEMAAVGETAGACPVFILATAATDKSRTAKLLIDRKDALVAMFYPPEVKDVVREVAAMANAAGLKHSGDLMERVARAANLDLRVAQSEIDKLALYLDASAQAPKVLTGEVIDLIGATTEEDDVQDIVNTVLGGETGKMPAQLGRIRELGINPVTVALALERRAAQLAGLAARMGGRRDIAEFVASQPQVFYKERREIIAQLKCWPPRKLDRLVPRLTELHRALLGNSQTADLLLAQALTQIARVAHGTRR